MFMIGIPLVSDLAVEFWNSIFQCGSVLAKKLVKWDLVASEPGLPGTRVWRIGERSVPLWMLKSVFGRGR